MVTYQQHGPCIRSSSSEAQGFFRIMKRAEREQYKVIRDSLLIHLPNNYKLVATKLKKKPTFKDKNNYGFYRLVDGITIVRTKPNKFMFTDIQPFIEQAIQFWKECGYSQEEPRRTRWAYNTLR